MGLGAADDDETGNYRPETAEEESEGEERERRVKNEWERARRKRKREEEARNRGETIEEAVESPSKKGKSGKRKGRAVGEDGVVEGTVVGSGSAAVGGDDGGNRDEVPEEEGGLGVEGGMDLLSIADDGDIGFAAALEDTGNAEVDNNNLDTTALKDGDEEKVDECLQENLEASAALQDVQNEEVDENEDDPDAAGSLQAEEDGDLDDDFEDSADTTTTLTTPGRKPPTPLKSASKIPVPQICNSCTTHNLECSILDDPSSYPCAQCRELSLPCSLPSPRTPAQRLGSATADQQRRNAEREAQKAKAKKVRDAVRRQEIKLHELKKAMREVRMCMECRKVGEGESCSLKRSREGVGECKRCVKEHRVCLPWVPRAVREAEKKAKALGNGQQPPLPNIDAGSIQRQVRRAKKKAERKKKVLPAEPEPERPLPSADHPLLPGWSRKEISTSYSHPLLFNCPPSSRPPHPGTNLTVEDGDNCSLHVTAFAIFGWGSTKVHVKYPLIPSSSHPAIFHEIPGTGGHSDRGAPPTKICRSCTLERQKIIFCGLEGEVGTASASWGGGNGNGGGQGKGHVLRGIDGLESPDRYDFDAAYSLLLQDQDMRGFSNTASALPGGWCSICPSPAFFECCAPRPVGLGVGGKGRDRGCGLKVCDVCAELLLGGDGAALDKMVRDVARRRKLWKRLRESDDLEDGIQAELAKARVEIRTKVSLDEVVEGAMKEVRGVGGPEGRFKDGVRADAELLTRGEGAWLWLWMKGVEVVEGQKRDEEARQAYLGSKV